MTEYNLDQTDLNTFLFEVVDAETKQPMPAKVRFEALPPTTPAPLGAPWDPLGARYTVYLRPGPNPIPLRGGHFKCIFSRGPEYDVVEREVNLIFEQPQTVRAELTHAVKTPGMVSVDMDVPTDASPSSRVKAEDLVLAAAGEGVEWIVSGDLGRATDLGQAIKSQGLEQWIRASAGARISCQSSKLFGEFFVFPLPANTSAQKLESLAASATPAQFFKAVRQAFPGVMIAVMQPMAREASYFGFFGMNIATGKPEHAKDFSFDFDAIGVFEGKETDTEDAPNRKTAWRLMETLTRNGQPKLPLASSRCATLYHEEPGYPRTYILTGKEDLAALTDSDLTAALRAGRYFITNGPIIEQALLTDPRLAAAVRANAFEMHADGRIVAKDGSEALPDFRRDWPARDTRLKNAECLQLTRVLQAPWLRLERFYLKKDGDAEVLVSRQVQPDLMWYPFDQNSVKPYLWLMHYTDKDKEQAGEIYEDCAIYTEVRGMEMTPVVTMPPLEPYRAFAITAPVLVDGDGDGRFSPKAR